MVTRSEPRLPTVTSCSMDMNTTLTYLEQQRLPRHSLEIANRESRITNHESRIKHKQRTGEAWSASAFLLAELSRLAEPRITRMNKKAATTTQES